MNGQVDPVAVIGGLARVLRRVGVEATQGRMIEAVRALEDLDPTARGDVYWAGRLAFCADPDEIRRYDRAFRAVFDAAEPGRPPVELAPSQQHVQLVDAGGTDGPSAVPAADVAPVAVSASRRELLRDRDFAELTPAERAQVDRLLTQLRLPGETRPTRRYRAAPRGRVDRARTVRAMLRRGGEPERLRHRRRRDRPRGVVLLVDVSGSMSAYATALLRFAHAAARRGEVTTEVFTIGTRLTRVTREMSHRDADAAMAAVADEVPDWSGGTRLGQLLKRFLDRWGQRGTARGAVVVILSDGWERGDVTVLERQMQRLTRLAHRVVWANPRKARSGYEPLAAGMAAALPHVDDFVAGNSLAALEDLARVVAGATRERTVAGATRETTVAGATRDRTDGRGTPTGVEADSSWEPTDRNRRA